MIYTDLHNHTSISHGTHSATDMYEAGKKAGLRHMGFSEHSPLPPGFYCALYTGDLEGDFPAWVAEVCALKQSPGYPKALLGLELDWLPGRIGWMRELTHKWPFDYVLGSLHYLDGWSVGNIRNWGPAVGREERFARFNAYYYEMASMASSGLVQAASHPDFIKLRAWPDFQLWLETPQSRQALATALESMARHNVAMEVSSAGLRQPFHEIYPCPAIMKLARDIGVEIVFGSDAHRPDDVGASFDILAGYASSFGYSRSLLFENRQPTQIPFA